MTSSSSGRGQRSPATTSAASPSARGGGHHAAGEIDAWLEEWLRTGDPALRDKLILSHRNLVIFLARRFVERGDLLEDVVQQGMVGLMNALDHYRPEFGVRFATFATPTIVGEIRRYFRDRTPSLRVPRRLHEIHQQLLHRAEVLTQQLNRSPTYDELAQDMGLSVEMIAEALEVPHFTEPLSMEDHLPKVSEVAAYSPVSEHLGVQDHNLENWLTTDEVRGALAQLPALQQQVLHMVYFQGYSQAEIATQLGYSQMHISRLHRRALTALRKIMSS